MGTREGIRRISKPVPLVEIADDRRVLIEFHQGISSYTAEEISVRVCYGQIRVLGTQLCIARMTKEQLVICGKIECVTLERRGRA